MAKLPTMTPEMWDLLADAFAESDELRWHENVLYEIKNISVDIKNPPVSIYKREWLLEQAAMFVAQIVQIDKEAHSVNDQDDN